MGKKNRSRVAVCLPLSSRVAGSLSTPRSAYHLRVMVAMYTKEETRQKHPTIKPSFEIALAVGIFIILVLLMDVYPTPYLGAARSSVLDLF